MRSTIRRILKEDVNNTLYDKIIKMMRRPYVDFLRKNGLGDKKTVEEMMKRKLGDGIITYTPSYESGTTVYKFIWRHDNKGYYEEHKYTYTDVIWVHMEKVEEGSKGVEIITLQKNNSNWGKKEYFELTDDRSEIKHHYYTDTEGDGTSWDDAPIEIKNDKFFSTNY